jgi:hypothetical protein
VKTARAIRAITVAGAVLALLPSPASANGAMSLALGTFGWELWSVYVVATVLFEAFVMGRWLRLSFGKALLYSLGANFLTAIAGGVISGVVSYGFLGVFGSRLNPNPFAQTLFLFTLFGLGSGLVEAIIWRESKPVRSGEVTGRRVLALSLAAHLVGVPLGLAILLAPDRPYRGLEMQVEGERGWLENSLRNALNEYIAEHQALPPDRTYEEVLERLRPRLDRFGTDPGLWAAAYRADYHRFDTGERRRAPIEWNAAAAGEKPFEGPPRTIWRTRSCWDGWCTGLVFDGGVRRTSDRQMLGFAGER